VVATSTLARLAPAFAALTPVASGLLAVPVSTVAGEWLIWFRPEQVRTVTWGGMPFKPIPIGDDPAELSPRRSFAKWHQVVQGSAEPWTPRDLAAARLIGETVTDVVLQFRAVRTLIAQDQLDQVRRQVAASDQPVVILDPHGRIQLTNDAFEALMPPAVAGARRVDDLLPAFAEPAELRRRLRDVLENRRSWRGELRVQGPTGEVPLLVRADPVLSAPDRVLGFVFLFTDLAGRKAVDQARRRFQERILDRQRPRAGRLDGPADLVFRGLLATVVENAQLAALEVTDGGDPAGMPAMLESLRDSVARTAAVLEVLIAHAARAGDPPAPGDAP
jgi:PAS domain-containing protein